MNTYHHKQPAIRTVFASMWRSWTLAFGSIVLPVLCAIFLRRAWLPLIIFAEIYVIVTLTRGNMFRDNGGCQLLTRNAVRILTISMVVMLAIVILCTDALIPTVIHLDLYNSEIPFITSLVIFPATALVCGFQLATGMVDRQCSEFRRINNFYGDSIIGTVYYREVRYQLSILLIISILLGIVEYWYYFTRYINANINTPDIFFFDLMPALVYAVSVVVMGIRYANMYHMYMVMDESRPERANTTRVRFLVFRKNDLLLQPDANDRLDTPLESIIEKRSKLSDDEACRLFRELTSADKFTLRYCYTSEDLAKGANTILYSVFMNTEESTAMERPDENWFNAYMLDAALEGGIIAPVLANELFRIHTITMAWKTYDRNGRRLYPIKHYRPTFRFGDMPQWNVDYDDTSWLSVAYNNEDKHFYRLRAIWERMTGILDRSRHNKQ